MKSPSRVRLLATPWTAAYQAPPSMGLSRQEHWSGVPLPSPGNLTAAAAAKSLQSCPTLCNPMDYSPPGCSVCGIVQARILEWVAMPSSGDLPDSGLEPLCLMSPELAGGFFSTSARLGSP